MFHDKSQIEDETAAGIYIIIYNAYYTVLKCNG